MNRVKIEYPRTLDKYGNWISPVQLEKHFLKYESARSWANEVLSDVSENYGNRWPRQILVNGKDVFRVAEIIW